MDSKTAFALFLAGTVIAFYYFDFYGESMTKIRNAEILKT